MYTILTKNGIDNSNTTATYKNYFNTGMRSGVVKGVLNECQISATMSNIISINTGFIFISGHEVVITSVESKTMTTTPTTGQRYGLIARLTVGDDLGKPTFEFIVRQADVAIRQDNLFDDGKGIYEIEMATFSYSEAGITNIIRSFEIITGASGVGADLYKISQEEFDLFDYNIKYYDGDTEITGLLPDKYGYLSGCLLPANIAWCKNKELIGDIITELKAEDSGDKYFYKKGDKIVPIYSYATRSYQIEGGTGGSILYIPEFFDDGTNGIYPVVGIYTDAFKNNTNITDLIFQRSSQCVIIFHAAFYGCIGLTNIILPVSIKVIEPSAFQGCINLTSITLLSETPPKLYQNFPFYNTNNCPIYVPTSSVETYKEADVWKDYADRIFPRGG